jgi:DNA-binding SARP family transcriptional activator
VWLAVLVAGLPWTLIALFGIPVPRHLPQQPYLREWISLTVVWLLWVIWLVLLAMVGLHVRAAVRRVRIRRLRIRQLRVADPPEGLAAGLLGAAVVAFTTAGSRGTMTAVPPPAAVDTSPLAGPAAQAGSAAQAGPAAEEASLRTASPNPVDTPATAAGSDVGGRPVTGPQSWTDPVGNTAAPDSGVATGHEPTHGDQAGRYDGEQVEGEQAGHERVGVALPDGGWISRDVATAVSSAAGVVWLRRRRRYQPQPSSGSSRQDADLSPLPDTAAVVIAALGEHDPSTPARSDSAGSAAAVSAPGQRPDAAGTPAAVVGQRRDGPLRLADLPAGGIGLTGPAAADAARGILTAALLAASPAHPDLAPQVLTTAADLALLFGPNPLPAGRHAGLIAHRTSDELLEAVETHVLHRISTARDLDQPDTRSPDSRSPTRGRQVPLLVLTRAPDDPRQARRLAVLLTHSSGGLGITGVMVGSWAHGVTWQVAADGTTYPQPTGNGAGTATAARLCVLPPPAATDLLTLLADSRSDDYRPDDYRPDDSRPGDRARGHTEPSTPPVHPPAAAKPPNLQDIAATRTADHVPSAIHTTTDMPPTPSRGRLFGDDHRAPLRLRLLGGTNLHQVQDPATPVRLARSAARQILVYLAVHPGGATSAELAAAIWPGVRPRPVNRLYTAASALRGDIAHATGLELLIRSGDRYRLNSDLLSVDLWQLHAAADRAVTATDPDRSAVLHTVTRLYTGELAAGQHWPWLQPHRETIRRQVIDAYTTLATAADPTTAAALLDAAVQVDPVNEALHQRAIRAHLTAGQPAHAARLLADLTTQLAAFGEHPQPATQRLVE